MKKAEYENTDLKKKLERFELENADLADLQKKLAR